MVLAERGGANVEGCRETEFRDDAFPNGVWERGLGSRSDARQHLAAVRASRTSSISAPVSTIHALPQAVSRLFRVQNGAFEPQKYLERTVLGPFGRVFDGKTEEIGAFLLRFR